MGWLLPLGSHKVMGSFAGYSVSVSTCEIVRLFFNGFFFWCCDLMDCFFGRFFPRPRTSYSSPCTYRSTFSLRQDFLDVIFFWHGLVYSFGHQKSDQKLFWFSYAWRRLVMSEEDSWCLKKPDESFHAHQKTSSSTSTPWVPPSCASDTNLTVTYTLRLTD